MRSNIINMADRMKDNEDAALEALFRSEPIADDGFSARVLSRVRRRVWVRRLALPLAVAVGAAISAPAILDVAVIMNDLAGMLPTDSLGLPAGILPQTSAMLIAGAVTIAALFALPALED